MSVDKEAAPKLNKALSLGLASKDPDAEPFFVDQNLATTTAGEEAFIVDLFPDLVPRFLGAEFFDVIGHSDIERFGHEPLLSTCLT